MIRIMKSEEIIEILKSVSDPKAVQGMARFGITPDRTFGISIPDLRKLAKDLGKDHYLAEELWGIGYRETRILASLIAEPSKVTEDQMDTWVKDFDCWEVCDQTCMNLFRYTVFAHRKATEWSGRDEEFVKRAGFALMATLAVSDKNANDCEFEKFFLDIKREATDERNYVRKAINWALRQIGKRSLELNIRAIEVAEDIKEFDSKAARWISSDALRELTSEKVQAKLKKD
ncbi:MAG: DNA alkylation repair protein [Halobacteriota archaeon]|nr:DNA alkylation repair protein [Halobacteriota archaeon]